MSIYTKEANMAWNVLNGVFNIYKPPGIHYLSVKETIISNLCRDLNDMRTRPPLKHVHILGPTNEKMKVVVKDSYADHPLVVGPRYKPEYFKFIAANPLCREASGVLICGINYGTKLIHKLKESNLTKFYRVKGILGQQRRDDWVTGKIIEKSVWKKVKRANIDRVCASLQASHQKKMFEISGLDIQSQEAYDLAVKGPIRPAISKIPMIYSIKCVHFQPPEFTIEVVCLNDSLDYLKSLISEIGLKVHSSAHCSYIQCSHYAQFSVKDSLLSKNWNLQNIINGISECHKIINKNPYMIKQEHANLVQANMEQKKEDIV